MADGGGIVAGAAGAAQAIPALIGRGKSQYQAQDISQSGMYDPFAYQFGNFGAENYAQGREQQARAIDQRAAPQADYTQANQDRFNAAGAREGQQQAAQLMMNRATGATPSIAGMQAAQDMQRAQAAQAAQAASARGPAAVALAQQNRANNTANVMGRISGQSQINAANERMQAEQAAFGANAAMRGQDYQGQQNAAQQAQYNAGLQLGSRQANDARAIGTQQMGHQAQLAEQQGRVQMQGIAAQSQAAAQGTNAKTEAQNAENKGLIETVGDFFSDARTKYITSDFSSKLSLQGTPLPSLAGGGGMTTSTWGGGGTSPMSGAAPASFDALNGGGMDVLGSLQKHSDFATQYQADPTGGMTGGAMGTSDLSFPSDDKTKLRAAFEEGAKYADASHAGVQIKPPAYAAGKPEAPRNPTLGPKPDDKAEMAHLQRMEQLRGEHVSQPAPVVVGDPARGRLAPAQVAVAAPQMVARALPPVAPSFGSDFTTKIPLRGGGLTRDADGNPATGDANAPRYQFDPRIGWFDPNAPQRPDLNAAIEEQAGQDREDADIERRIAEQRAKDGHRAASDRAMAEENEPKADDGQRMAPGTADFEKSKAKSSEEGKPVNWWDAIGTAGKSLNEAQFGYRSDRRAKNVIDLDEGTDKATMRDGSSDPRTNSMDKTFHRDTPQDQARVKRAFEDRAGKDADAMMAGFKANLGKGSAVDERVAASLQPSHSPVAEANRTMKGEPYIYKPQYTPPDQKPGEPNFGFMAQNLEKSPITATAVKEDPTGMKRVDALKLLRVLGASVADLQEQQDETRIALAKGGRGPRVKRRGVEAPEAGTYASDPEYVGPSGEGNRDYPDYNFIKSPSPLNIATALEVEPNAITPSTEAYMRRNGMWDEKTDALLESRGLRGGRKK